MNRTPRAITAGLLAALALAGCSGDPEPEIADPSPSPTAETSEPEEPTPPELPPAAEENNRRGAIAFTEHYWELANYAQRYGETKPLRAVSSPTCTTCTSACDFVSRIYQRGGSISGGDYTVSIIKVSPLFAGDVRSFDVRFESTNTEQLVSVPGKKDVTYGSETTNGRFILGWVGRSWRVDIWEIG